MVNQKFLYFLFISFITNLFYCAYPPYMYYETIPERNETPTSSSRGRFQSYAQMSQRLYEEIRSYIGTPYKRGGTSHFGMDCSGLVITVYKNVYGIHLPHNSSALSDYGRKIPLRNGKFGDLIFFSDRLDKRVTHVGIYLYDTKFVHSSSSRGVIISDLSTEKYYQQRYVGTRRITYF
ncbi:C40 family peptidase [candidate division KSB1 bacterium]|nr:C40 family peptidase [candidate division KSB1 bacterium]